MEKVSVIIPVYNSSKYIEECIDSVVNQTYKNLEIIIINDNSTDNSLSIINSFKDSRIKVINHRFNKGPSKTRNDGIRIATGRYITFLDSDDYWSLDKIEKQIKFIKKNKCCFIYSNYKYFKQNKTHIARVPSSLNYMGYLKNTAIFTSTVMLDMNQLDKKSIYMPDLYIGQDAATWINILKTGVTAYGMNEVLSIYRVGNSSVSSNKLKAIRRTWGLYKRENLPFVKRLYCFICYAFNATKRRML